MRMVESSLMTGNLTKEVIWRCAVGLYNSAIKQSHFFDVLRNTNYNKGKDFPFCETYAWLLTCTNKLKPAPNETEGGVGFDKKNDLIEVVISPSSLEHGSQIQTTIAGTAETDGSGAYYIVSRAEKFVKFITERQWEESKAPDGCKGG